MAKSSSSGAGCLMLFSLPFAGVGVVMLYLLVNMVWDAARMSEWPTTYATLQHVELERQYTSDGTTERAVAEYTYTVDGQSYRGNRVSLTEKADNIGSFHERKVRMLERAQRSGSTVNVYYDPDDSGTSILFPELRWEMIGFYMVFVLTFGGVGFGLLIGSLVGIKRAKARDLIQAERPEEPWSWKPEWLAGEIPSGGKTAAWGATFFSLFWNAISMPILFVFQEEYFEKGNKGILVGLIFPLIGFCMIGGTVYLWMRFAKYGNTRFVMQQVPGVIGGQLIGAIQVPRVLAVSKGVDLTLTSVRRVTTGSGKHRRTTERELWSSTSVIRQPRTTPRGESLLPVQFVIPYECEPVDESDTDNKVIWKLKAEADVTGVDFKAEFEVPVFKTEQSNPEFKIDRTAETLLPDEDSRRRLWEAEHLRVEPGARGATRLIFPAMRHKGSAISMVLMTLVWNGIAAGLYLFANIPVMFPIVFGLFGLILVFGCFDVVLRRTVLELSPGRLQARLGILACRGPFDFQGEVLNTLEIRHAYTSGNTEFFKLSLKDSTGKRRNLASQLRGRSNAEALLAYVKQQVHAEG